MRVIGHKKFVKTLKKMPVKTKQPVLDALHQGVDEVIDLSKSLVPVDQGDLKNSFEKQEYQKSKTASFGVEWRVTDFKAHWVEHGRKAGTKTFKVRRKGLRFEFNRTISWGATGQKPFFWPAYRVLKTRIKSRVTRAMKKSLKQSWKL